jgi:RNA polymerase sigma-70 factor (sigma-E family)
MDFEEFLSSSLAELLRFAVVLCGSRELGEDVLHDVLLRAHQRWAMVGAADSPYAYVRTMLVHEHLAWRRKWSRQIPVADLVDARTIPDHAANIVDRDEVRRRLAGLPARQRAVVALRYYGGLSDNEIAETLQCSPGTVRGYLSRALTTLRVEMSEHTVEESR